jgi:hypothetical protein
VGLIGSTACSRLGTEHIRAEHLHPLRLAGVDDTRAAAYDTGIAAEQRDRRAGEGRGHARREAAHAALVGDVAHGAEGPNAVRRGGRGELGLRRREELLAWPWAVESFRRRLVHFVWIITNEIY